MTLLRLGIICNRLDQHDLYTRYLVLLANVAVHTKCLGIPDGVHSPFPQCSLGLGQIRKDSDHSIRIVSANELFTTVDPGRHPIDASDRPSGRNDSPLPWRSTSEGLRKLYIYLARRSACSHPCSKDSSVATCYIPILPSPLNPTMRFSSRWQRSYEVVGVKEVQPTFTELPTEDIQVVRASDHLVVSNSTYEIKRSTSSDCRHALIAARAQYMRDISPANELLCEGLLHRSTCNSQLKACGSTSPLHRDSR
ncbi:hypothetical protein AG1IA_02859 [Rhizoctonia solani AG-1 IA]|uniref:Uncharacterized protein n=1 Tax=Thanatephorus cucumeris (strain AG1-IA) TaxID=983506 RepID=L8X240_THACA|nr:hypothetical protein AG1IA_02859 [Rhizoctonia solani AG-1 IA]